MAERYVSFADAGRASGDRGESGFTLIEMLVALAIFSLAALALLRLQGATVTTTGQLQDQALAQIVARNIAVEALTDPPKTASRPFGVPRKTASRPYGVPPKTASRLSSCSSRC